jgi:hypothetical protein
MDRRPIRCEAGHRTPFVRARHIEVHLSLSCFVGLTRAREISFCDFGCARRPRSWHRGCAGQRHTRGPRSAYRPMSTLAIVVVAGAPRDGAHAFGASADAAAGRRELRGRLRLRPLFRECRHFRQHIAGKEFALSRVLLSVAHFHDLLSRHDDLFEEVV